MRLGFLTQLLSLKLLLGVFWFNQLFSFEIDPRISKIDSTDACIATFVSIVKEEMPVDASSDVAEKVVAFLEHAERMRVSRADLEKAAWELFPQFLALLQEFKGEEQRESLAFAAEGFFLGKVDEDLNEAVLEAHRDAHQIPFFVEDCDPSYLFSDLSAEVEEQLNADHVFYMLADKQKMQLTTVLQTMKDTVAEVIGSKWRVLNIRCWETGSNAKKFGPNAWHTDGMPGCIYKLMYYPLGVDQEKGTLELRLNSGDVFLESGRGTWVLFKNSAVLHRGVAPEKGVRLAYEITITPSPEFDIRPITAGLNARHPILPWKEQKSQRETYSENVVTGINIGGGPNWACKGWVNLEEVSSQVNPTPFKLYPNCQFPFVDKSVAIVYSSHALEHLNRATVSRVLSESARVLKDKGVLVIKVPDYDKALECWREKKPGFFKAGWNFEGVIDTWASRHITDSLDFRAAMIFCSFFNDEYGNPFRDQQGKSRSSRYFGPPVVSVEFLRALISSSSPSEIASCLRKNIRKTEKGYQFCHQSAWSREEFKQLLHSLGYEVITFDSSVILEKFYDIPGIESMREQSMYCLARKKL